jgi:hypothetical protein
MVTPVVSPEVVIGLLLFLGICRLFIWWLERRKQGGGKSGSTKPGKATTTKSHLIIESEDAEQLLDPFMISREVYLPDTFEDIIELDYDGMQPPLQELQSRLQQNREENMKRLRRNLESKLFG